MHDLACAIKRPCCCILTNIVENIFLERKACILITYFQRAYSREISSIMIIIIMVLCHSWTEVYLGTKYLFTRGKSLLELWVTTFLPDRLLPLIFVWFISNFLCMCSNSMNYQIVNSSREYVYIYHLIGRCEILKKNYKPSWLCQRVGRLHLLWPSLVLVGAPRRAAVGTALLLHVEKSTQWCGSISSMR